MGEYGGVLADRYPPPAVWRQVDEAARSAEALWAVGRAVDFELDADGHVRISLAEDGKPVRDLSILEVLAVAAGAPV